MSSYTPEPGDGFDESLEKTQEIQRPNWQGQLRGTANMLRRVPMKLMDLIPLLQQVADAMDADAKNAARFKWCQNNPQLAQAFFWNYTSRKQRAKAIDAKIAQENRNAQASCNDCRTAIATPPGTEPTNV